MSASVCQTQTLSVHVDDRVEQRDDCKIFWEY